MEEEKEYLAGWWVWVLVLLVFSIIVLSLLGYAGKIGNTIVEREVFEQSYQRSESLKSEVANYEAQLTEINSQLSRSDLDASTRSNLEAQRSTINVMLNTARRKQ